VLGILVLLIAVFGTAVTYYLYEGRSREVAGSSTEEFVPEENPVDTTTVPTTKAAPPPLLEAQWPTYGRDVQRTHVSPAKHRPPYRRVWMHRARH
jgi:hypothetical protein